MRDTILVVDDEELNRELLRQIFEDDYNIVTAENGQEAIEQFGLCQGQLAAMLLDIVMPVKTGFDVLHELQTNYSSGMEFIPVIMITASTDSESAMRCYRSGAIELIPKPFVASEVKQRVTNMIELYSSRELLKKDLVISERKLTESQHQLEKFNDSLVLAIGDIIEFRDMESGQHVKRVKGLTRILAETYRELYPECALTAYDLDLIERAAALHDIGKIVISDSILLKPGRLTPEERKIMETHTTRGCDVLAKLEGVQDMDHYKVAYEIVRHHHERYDGNGYPDKLKGDEIPLSAQFVSVADVYDALTSERVYKKAFSKEKAYQMILNNECGVFGPKLMRSFERARPEIEKFVDATNGTGEAK